MQPDNQNSYDFILNPDQKRSVGPSFAGPQKILMILGLFTGVIIISVILFSLISSSGGTNRTNLVATSAHQTELIRVLKLGMNDVNDPNLRQKFQTLLTTTSTDSQEISALISSREIEITLLEKNAQKDAKIDEDLKEAKQRKNFDPAFEAAVNKTTTKYFQSLQATLSSAISAQEKEALSTALTNVQTIAE